MKKIYFLYGSDCEALTARINELKDQIKISGDLTVENYVLSKLDEVELFFNQSLSLSLFQNISLEIVEINLRAFNQLEKRVEEFTSFIQNLSTNKFVFLVLHMEKLDKTTAKKISDSELFNSLKNIAVLEEFAKVMPWQTEQIKEKIMKTSMKYNLTFSNKALELYFNHIKDNLNNFDSELKSISLYLMPKNYVDEKCINSFFNTSLNIDDLFNAIISCKSISILNLKSLLDKIDSPLYVIAALQNKFRQILLVKTFLNLNIGIYQISKQLEINLYKLEKDIGKIKTISSETLINILSKLSELELKTKMGLVSSKNLLDLISIYCIPCPV